MKLLNYISLVLFISLAYSCLNNETKYTANDDFMYEDGIVVFFSGQCNDKSDLFISINGHIVYDTVALYGKLDYDPYRIDIKTNIRDSLGYNFYVKYLNVEKTFYIEDNIDSLIISFGAGFYLNKVDRTMNDTTFALFITKNVTDICNIKIAMDNDTVYDGLFLNNYPNRKYNTMRLPIKRTNKRFADFYVEIWENKFIHFGCDFEKTSAINVDMDCSFFITTNLDNDWEGCWMYD